MPLVRFPTPTGLVYTIDLSKIADRENARTVEAPGCESWQEPVWIDWGDGTSETYSSGDWIEHTYAEGAGEVFTVVIRSATGHLPLIRFTPIDVQSTSGHTKNVSLAVTSIDHFNGLTGKPQTENLEGAFKYETNLTYIDTRFVGLWKWVRLRAWFTSDAALTQPIESFCLHFATNLAANGIAYAWQGCGVSGDMPKGFLDGQALLEHAVNAFRGTRITSIPADLFDKCVSLKSLNSAFHSCSRLIGTPYIFWKADGSIDNDKLPALTDGDGCYASCDESIRAQVPEAYGGTMTVS